MKHETMKTFNNIETLHAHIIDTYKSKLQRITSLFVFHDVGHIVYLFVQGSYHLPDLLPDDWREELKKEFSKTYFKKLQDFIEKEYEEKIVYPPIELLFAAYHACPFKKVKVPTIGQDPYINEHQAIGQCFGVKNGLPLPRSLENIRKEMHSDLGVPDERRQQEEPSTTINLKRKRTLPDICFFEDVEPEKKENKGQEPKKQTETVQKISKTPNEELKTTKKLRLAPFQGDLTYLSEQGVFLINRVLSVVHGSSNSHAGRGWEQFTDATMMLISKKPHLVVIMWGSAAKTCSIHFSKDKHLQLTSPHPSPLSASRGFFGCRHFSQANAYLIKHGLDPIQWL